MTDASTPAVPPSKPIWTRWWMIVIYVIVGLGIIGSLGGDDDDPLAGAPTTTDTVASDTTEPSSTTTETVETTTTGTPTTSLPPTTTTTVPERVPAFGDGIQEVGVDIPPGIYETGVLGEDDLFDGCYWERLAGFSGEFDEIIANENATVHAMVDIMGTDVGFNSDCGGWYVVEPLEEPLTTIPPGMWAVSVHIAAGQYGAPGGDSCYWERLSGLSGELDDIIANDLPTGAAIVEIAASDVAFSSSGCGEWTLR